MGAHFEFHRVEYSGPGAGGMVFVECSPRLFTEFCLAFVKYSHSLSPISNYQKLNAKRKMTKLQLKKSLKAILGNRSHRQLG